MKKILAGLIVMMMVLGGNALAQTSPGYSDFKVVSTIYEPYPAEPGKYMDLYVKVENLGTRPATDSTFELLPKYPFSLDSDVDAVKNYGRIEPSQPVLLTYKVRVDKNAVPGNSSIDLRYRTGEEGLWFTISFDIYVKPRDTILSIEKVESVPDDIVAGGKADVEFTLKNLANTQIRDITLKLDMSDSATPFAPVGSTTEKRIEKLEPGEEETVLFRVISEASAEPKVYKIPITLTYSDEAGTTYTKNDIVGLLISSDPEIQVYMEESDTFMGGTKGSIIVSMSNIGATQAKFVSIVLAQSKNYEILGPDRTYIGNLDSDDFDTAEFKLYVDESLNDTKIPVLVTVTYKDAYNDEHVEDFELELPIYSREHLIKVGEISADGGSNTLVYAVVLIVVLYIVYRIFRRKKRS
ncbi:MAG: COG1361 S-layer family protein [Candidatus Aenigmarchaeota archaeon]|nr:COG1361 S-layer family protein [Candidatus Aenigmarchaeota archaeon]